MPSSNGFPRTVNNQPGVAARGDFADANIRASVVAGEAALVALGGGRQPVVGNFAWADQDAGTAFSVYRGETAKIGFVHREQQALITEFLGAYVLAVAVGSPTTLLDQGSFWAAFAAGASVGQAVYAKYIDGSCVAATAGTSTQTADVTASIATTGIMTVSAVSSGTLAVGAVMTGTGFTPVQITALLSGTGNTGTYQTTGTATVTSRAMLAAESEETDFIVTSPALSGELAKISTWG